MTFRPLNRTHREIMDMLVQGFTISRIAEETGLSDITVSTIIHQTIELLEAESLPQATAAYKKLPK